MRFPHPSPHHLADARRGDLAFADGFNLALDARDELVDPLLLDAPLATREGDRLLDLAAGERFVLAIALDHRDLAQLHPFERRETRAAAFALAAPADRRVVL